MKNYLFLILISITLYSCGLTPVPVNDLALIDKDIKLDDAKTVYADYYDEDDIVTLNDGGHEFTYLTFNVHTTVTSYLRFSAMGSPQASSGSARYSDESSNFYMIFKDNDFYYSGFEYEAKIHDNKEIIKILKTGIDNMEEE